MRYQGYSVELHSINVPVVNHLNELLERVESINSKHLIPNPSAMLRKLGQWAQEFFQPRKWKDADKLVIQHDTHSHQIAVYFDSLTKPQLTIRYDPETTE